MASRGLWHFMSARTRRSLALSWSALFVLSLLLQYFSFALASPALAVHDENLFELDGNATNDPSVTGDDWNSHPGATGNRFTLVTDPLDAATDKIFTGGGSKDGGDTSSWKWTTGSVLDKDNIEHAFAASYVKNGHTFVYFGLDKYSVDGDSNVGFWFFKNGIGTTGAGGFTPKHTIGDLFVASQFTNGGDVSTIDLYEWNGTTAILKASGEVSCTASPAADIACADANTGPVPAPWAYTPKSGTANIYPTASFFEGGIDLDKLFGGKAPCFSGFLAETRSSQALSAVLKDFASGGFNTCVPPTLDTNASVSTFHFGDAGVTDTASLSGTDGPASGKVKFFVCSPAQLPCDTGGTQIGPAAGVAVTTSDTGGTATSTPAFVPTAAGKYCFRAEYVPDSASQYLAASHTNNDTECFTVVKNDTGIATSANEAVDIGASISDSAVLSGATPDATGTITFKAYGPGTDCSGTAAFTTTATVVGGKTNYGPVSFVPTTAGVYHWIASYGGDAKNNGSTGACLATGENDTVNQVSPSISTQASGQVIVGGQITDTATVTGGHSPTGTVTFRLYGPTDPNCTSAAIFTSPNRPLSGGSATSAAYTTAVTGTYQWIATYNGDANNIAVAGKCGDGGESVVVNPTNPSIATSLVGGGKSGANITVPLGTAVHDTSTLTGATGDAGGTVHYQIFDNANCTGTPTDAGTANVVNGVPGSSINITFNHAGTFYWQADYSGDLNNNKATSACRLETVTLDKAIPALSTQASAPVTVGGVISDTAHLTGGFNATGTISFMLFLPGDTSCANGTAVNPAKTVNGDGFYTSASVIATQAGT
jgi:hypothetical protein